MCCVLCMHNLTTCTDSALTMYDLGVVQHHLKKYTDAHDKYARTLCFLCLCTLRPNRRIRYEEALMCLRPQLGVMHSYLSTMQTTFASLDSEMRRVVRESSAKPIDGLSADETLALALRGNELSKRFAAQQGHGSDKAV